MNQQNKHTPETAKERDELREVNSLLLEAVKGLVPLVGGASHIEAIAARARAVIAKAEGRAE
jgi:hypothetical protein